MRTFVVVHPLWSGLKRIKTIFQPMKYILTILCCICLASTARAVTQQEARAYVANGQYAQAVTAYRTLMQQPTLAKNADCNKLFGQALCMTGAYEEAVPYLEFAAGKSRSAAWWYLALSRQHLYDFEGAIAALEKYRPTVKKDAEWQARIDSVMSECQIGLKGIGHVQNVVIIDSIIVARDLFFSHYMLGAESGRMLDARKCGEPFATLADSTETAIFENQAADYRLMSVANDGRYSLYEFHLFNGVWSEPQRIASIDVGGRCLCFPFLRSDSETLFFACDSTPGFGGLDIYKTHYSTDTESYYAPERLGMPFNSPFDDYMMAIDETHQVGWWATNRNTPADKVCIYLFMADETPAYLDGRQPERARVASIADTWRRQKGYEALVEEIFSAPQFVVEKEEIRIPISDTKVYTSADQFRSPKAREAYEQSLNIEADLLAVQGDLDSMRQDYHSANSKHREALRQSILKAEKREEELIGQLRETQKKYRNLEIGK